MKRKIKIKIKNEIKIKNFGSWEELGAWFYSSYETKITERMHDMKDLLDRLDKSSGFSLRKFDNWSSLAIPRERKKQDFRIVRIEKWGKVT